MKMKILYLTLHKKAFEAVLSGGKQKEYRKPSKWILSRLKGKGYDRIRFTNGYGRNRPFIEVSYRGWEFSVSRCSILYFNGLMVEVAEGDVIISFGTHMHVAPKGKFPYEPKANPNKQ